MLPYYGYGVDVWIQPAGIAALRGATVRIEQKLPNYADETSTKFNMNCFKGYTIAWQAYSQN